MKNKILVLMCAFAFVGCKKNATESSATDIQETAQQVGDAMASADEAGGGSGSYASNMQNSIQSTFERYAPDDKPSSHLVASLFLPTAEATSCLGYGFGSCSGTSLVRNFNSCTVGSAVLSGDVTFSWGGGASTCAMTAIGHHVSRSPNFTLSGRRGATLAVSKTGSNGQRVEVVSGSGGSRVFAFSNDGINRKFTLPNSTVLFDFTTTTTSNISITGTSRSDRVMDGGALRVTNNLTSVTCDYVPTNVTWASGCNCPTQGSWSGSCSDGKSTTLDITGCGTATYSEGSNTESLTFDRCGT